MTLPALVPPIRWRTFRDDRAALRWAIRRLREIEHTDRNRTVVQDMAYEGATTLALHCRKPAKEER